MSRLRPSSFDQVHDLDDEDTLLAKLESAGAPFGGPAEARGSRLAGPGSPRRNARRGLRKTARDGAAGGHTFFAGRAKSPLVLPKSDPMRFVGGAVFASGETAAGEFRMPSPLQTGVQQQFQPPQEQLDGGAPVGSPESTGMSHPGSHPGSPRGGGDSVGLGGSSMMQQAPKTPRPKLRTTTRRLFERRDYEENNTADAAVDFQRVIISGSHDTESDEAVAVGTKIARAMELRDKYLLPMPKENWGGLDPEFYRDFMVAKGICLPKSASPVGTRKTVSARGNDSNPTSVSVGTSHFEMNKKGDLKTRETVINARAGGEKTRGQKKNTLTTPSLFDAAPKVTAIPTTGIKMMRQTSTDRLRRRMDVPFDPYARNVMDVPETLTGASFVCEAGVFSAFLSEPIRLSSRSVSATATSDERIPTSPRRRISPKIPGVHEFYSDFDELLMISGDGPVRSFCFARLKLLEMRFRTHVQLNREAERDASANVPHRDFYNVRKVDTHIHHSACMNAKHLLRFIKHKLRFCPDEIVIHRDGEFLTLSEVFHSLNLTAYDLSVDTLDMHAVSLGVFAFR